MPKIHEEIVVLKLCRLIKKNQSAEPIINKELTESLISVAEELCGPGVVEIEDLE